MSAKFSCALVLLLGLFGCATPNWQMVKSDHVQYISEHFSVRLPSNWMRFGQESEGLLLSRDGVALQVITLSHAAHEEAFSPLEIISSSSLLPSELAELTIRLLKSQQGMRALQVIANQPAEIAGEYGFRLQLGFENQQGLNYQGVLYGLATEKRFFLLSFYATEIYYFQRDLPVFEKLVGSFELI